MSRQWENFDFGVSALPIDAMLAWLQSQQAWGHAPHWISASLAAWADCDEALAQACFAVAFGYGQPEWQAELFPLCRLLEEERDFVAGRRLMPLG